MTLVAFSAYDLGLFRVTPMTTERVDVSVASSSQDTTAQALSGGGAAQGFKTWIIALAVFVITAAVSGTLHRREASHAR
jgi:hypothetical protein